MNSALAKVGLVMVVLAAVACSSKDRLLQGMGGSGGSGGSGGTSGADAADAKDADASGGTTGTGGGTTGTGGNGGNGGSGGGGGTTTGAGGATGGGGGTTGTGGAGGARDGGPDVRQCEMAQCTRPYQCKRACGGPIETNGCCPCEAPLFDDFNGLACGDGGTGAISTLGCRYIGGFNRVVVGKRDLARNLCFNLVLWDNRNGTVPAGLTIPASTTFESAFVASAARCPAMAVPQSLPSTGVTGTLTEVTSEGGIPSSVNVDVTLTFGANDAGAPSAERISGTMVDVRGSCQ